MVQNFNYMIHDYCFCKSAQYAAYQLLENRPNLEIHWYYLYLFEDKTAVTIIP